MKKTLLIVAMIMACMVSRAQVNIQEMYDVNRGHLTTTLEMFKADKWGSTFFFTDIYHSNLASWPTDYYTEIARSLNFWQGTMMAPLSFHVEWNGGVGMPVYSNQVLGSTVYSLGGYPVSNAWLIGAEYFFHNGDFSNTLTLEVLYKNIRPYRLGNNVSTDATSSIPLQLTAVWGMNNIFGVKGLNFSGFADLWWENITWGMNADGTADKTEVVFLSEPQIWYNVGQHFGCENLMIGGEVELNYNFSGNPVYEKGFHVNPAAGIKWNF